MNRRRGDQIVRCFKQTETEASLVTRSFEIMLPYRKKIQNLRRFLQQQDTLGTEVTLTALSLHDPCSELGNKTTKT